MAQTVAISESEGEAVDTPEPLVFIRPSQSPSAPSFRPVLRRHLALKLLLGSRSRSCIIGR